MTGNNSITTIAKEVHKEAKSKGWWDEHKTKEDIEKSIPEKLALIHSEISEALEEYRKGNKPTLIYYSYHVATNPEKPEGIPIELADAVIRIFDLSEALGIDIESAILEKMAFNKTRSHRHGGKVC